MIKSIFRGRNPRICGRSTRESRKKAIGVYNQITATRPQSPVLVGQDHHVPGANFYANDCFNCKISHCWVQQERSYYRAITIEARSRSNRRRLAQNRRASRSCIINVEAITAGVSQGSRAGRFFKPIVSQGAIRYNGTGKVSESRRNRREAH